MKKEYMRPEVENISFQTEEELMTGGLPTPSMGVAPWPGQNTIDLLQ